MNDIGFVAQASHGFVKLMAQMGHVAATNVAEFNLFEITLNAFVGGEVGSVTRQAFQMKALGGTLGKELSHRRTVISRQAIPNDQKLAWKGGADA